MIIEIEYDRNGNIHGDFNELLKQDRHKKITKNSKDDACIGDVMMMNMPMVISVAFQSEIATRNDKANNKKEE